MQGPRIIPKGKRHLSQNKLTSILRVVDDHLEKLLTNCRRHAVKA